MNTCGDHSKQRQEPAVCSTHHLLLSGTTTLACEKNRNSAAIQVNHFGFVASGANLLLWSGLHVAELRFLGVGCGKNCARRRSDSRPLGRTPPRLLLFPHHGATPSADVVEHLFVEQDQKKTLSHWHGALAGRAEQLACLQLFKILLLLWSHLSSLSVPPFCRSLVTAATAETPRFSRMGHATACEGTRLSGPTCTEHLNIPRSSPRWASLRTSNKPLAGKRWRIGLLPSGSDSRSCSYSSSNSLNGALVASSKKP
jgi:hypothetical protein